MKNFDFDENSGHEQFADAIAHKLIPNHVDSLTSAQSTPIKGNSTGKPAGGSKIQHLSVTSVLAKDPGYIKVAYFDSSAIVKLLISDGSLNSVHEARMVFDSSGVVVRTTMICFAETLQVLKRKRFFPNKTDVQLSALEYCGAIIEIYCMVNQGPMSMDTTIPSLEVIFKSEDIATKYGIDHSDALQITTINGLNSSESWNSGTFLCTADQGLADAARSESIPVAFLK